MTRGDRRLSLAAPATVIDLHTSSYDAAAGAVLAVSAIRLSADRPGKTAPFEWRIPDALAEADDADGRQRQSAAFAAVWPALDGYLLDTMVIAHGAAWTRTVLKKATLAVGVGWSEPVFACTRRMARAAFPNLRSYGLDVLVEELALGSGAETDGLKRCRAIAELYRRCAAELSGSGTLDPAEYEAFLDHPGGTVGRRKRPH